LFLEVQSKAYACAMMGRIGAGEFWRKAVGAIKIPDSTSGI